MELGYLNAEDFKTVDLKATTVLRLLNGLLEHFQSYYKLALVGGKMGWRLSAFTDARAILQRFAT